MTSPTRTTRSFRDSRVTIVRPYGIVTSVDTSYPKCGTLSCSGVSSPITWGVIPRRRSPTKNLSVMRKWRCKDERPVEVFLEHSPNRVEITFVYSNGGRNTLVYKNRSDEDRSYWLTVTVDDVVYTTSF